MHSVTSKRFNRDKGRILEFGFGTVIPTIGYAVKRNEKQGVTKKQKKNIGTRRYSVLNHTATIFESVLIRPQYKLNSVNTFMYIHRYSHRYHCHIRYSSDETGNRMEQFD